jgi:hypothetical protein
MRVTVIALIGLFLLAGCTSSQAEQSPTPSPTSALATPGYASGGLGLSFADWSARWAGEPVARADGLHYDAGDAEIVISPPLAGNIWWIAIDWNAPVTRDAAQTAVRAMLPHDAVLRSSEMITLGILEHWHSSTLANRFPPDETIVAADGKHVTLNTWRDGQPGDFTVTITVLENGQIPGVILAIGDHS